MNAELEEAIDDVGREEVFRRAREIGWVADNPPEWVWRGIIAELRQMPKDNVITLPVVRIERCPDDDETAKDHAAAICDAIRLLVSSGYTVTRS